MFSLQRWVGGDGGFFALLETSAEQSVLIVRQLLEWVKRPADQPSLNRLAEIGRKNESVTEDILRRLCRSFVTPLDREDLEKLATALHKITKTLAKFSGRVAAKPPWAVQVDFSRQLTFIGQATETVLEMVKDVPRSPEPATVKVQNDRLHQIEGEADKLLLELLRDLYSGRHEALQVQALGELYELLEKAIDHCRDAGNLLFRMALKLS